MDDLSARIDDLCARWNRPDSPGCAIAVVRDGASLYARAFGLADLERDVPLTPASVFDIGSTGKQFTAMLIAILARRGALALDDIVQTHVPELPVYAEPITIRHLLHHTSGLRDYTALMALAGWHLENFYPEEELLRLICRQQGLNFRPGEAFLYSNTGYLLLGVIAQRVTGRSLRTLLREEIFEPLGMAATDTNDDVSRIVRGRALSYSPAEEGGYRFEASPSTGFGDGALLTTVGDLCRWDANFYDNRLGGGQELIRQLLAPGEYRDGQALTYGHGLFLHSYRGLPVVSHGGGWAGYRAELMRFPEQRTSVIVLANLGSIQASRLAKRIADVCLADAFPEPVPPSAPGDPGTVTLPDQAWQALAGLHRSATSGGVLELAVAEDGPVAMLFGRKLKLMALTPTRFAAVDWPFDLHFEVRGAGPDSTLAVRGEIQGPRPEHYHKIAFSPASAAQLAAYVGDYHSDELDATYSVALEGDQLCLRRRFAPPTALRPTTPDAFAARNFALQFTHDAANRVDAFVLCDGRDRNLRFVR